MSPTEAAAKIRPVTAPSSLFAPAAVGPAETQRLSRVGVVDVGSNSVRLVIFDGAARSPAYFFNEKVLCGLGRGLAETGRLNPEGKVRARAALRRFQAISQDMGIAPLLAVATAAMRVAEDGPAFRQEIHDTIGLDLKVIDGAEEARLAAQGVLLGWPEASGLVCDIGGSSMELARVQAGDIGWRRTSPLGPLELAKLGPNPDQLADRIDAELKAMRAEMPDLPRRMFLVGGSWRAIAKLDMQRRAYPLKVLHEYRLDAENLAATLDLVDARAEDIAGLRKGTGVSTDRMTLVPLAAQVLRGVQRVLAPSEIFVSSYGLREGLLYESMPPALRSADPLIEACRYAEARGARLPGFGRTLFEFLAPLWPRAPLGELRLIKAACLLHDVSWRTHPDYRAEVCFDYATRANLGGMSHHERVFLGLALMHRYKSGRESANITAMRDLIPPERARAAEMLGRAMRFGAMFTVGKAGAMGRLEWDSANRRLTLHLSGDTEVLFGEVAQGRFAALAKALEAEPQVVQI